MSQTSNPFYSAPNTSGRFLPILCSADALNRRGHQHPSATRLWRFGVREYPAQLFYRIDS